MDTQIEQLHIEYDEKQYKIGAISTIQSCQHPINNSFLLALSRSKTLAIFEYTISDSKIQVLSSQSIEASDIISNLAFDSEGKYLFVATKDKKISIFETSTNLNEPLYTRDAPKKIIKLLYDQGKLIYADKFGMMYQHELVINDGKVSLSEPNIPLGHYATIVDFIITPKSNVLNTQLIITADKDQRIRCSYWPDSFNIHSFCLGHNEFVTSLCLIESNLLNKFYLVSGAGDGTIILWDIEAPKNIQCISLSSNLDSSNSCTKLRADTKLKRITVSNLVFIASANILCVSIELYKGLLLYKLEMSNNEPRLVFYKTVQTSFAPLTLSYIEKQNIIWIGGVEIDEQIPLAIFNLENETIEVDGIIENFGQVFSQISENEIKTLLEQSLLERLYQKNAHQLNFSEPKKKKVAE